MPDFLNLRIPHRRTSKWSFRTLGAWCERDNDSSKYVGPHSSPVFTLAIMERIYSFSATRLKAATSLFSQFSERKIEFCFISLAPIDFPNDLIDVDTSASVMNKEQAICSLMFATHRKPVFLLFCSLFFSFDQSNSLTAVNKAASFSPFLSSPGLHLPESLRTKGF